ncbi:beta strand repeat-containing protein [Roseinatronobacter alkalisoli]|uniref:Autotransporter domain-containing protein n=1 Tax=Roseinatronobacter alkalisoli TaxID=3028235 RepID=A0ABT5TG24_9RHOB|nr:hypothetical protein [Roseinatronobacter sp. HJB301]MDD7972873.1 hypothetical protein [Roseinatronobacter sp. HJB301]
MARRHPILTESDTSNTLMQPDSGTITLRRPPARRRAILGTTALVLVLAGTAVQAQQWDDPSTGGDWGTAANWNPATVPDDNTAAVVVPVAVGGPQVIDLDGNSFTINSLTLNGDFDVNNGTLILDGAAPAAITLDGVATTAGIGADLTLAVDSDVITTDGDSVLTISGDIDGAGGLQINGAGTVLLSGANSFTGGTVVANGTLNNSGTLGDVDNQAAGTFNNLAGAIADAVTNAGTGMNDGTIASLDNLATGDFTNTGTISGNAENAGTLNHDAGTIGGTLTNTDGTTTVAAGASVTGTTTITGGNVDNSGTLADVDNQAGGTFNNLAGAIADAVTNAGTGMNAGTIASLGNLAGGVFTNTGTISGNAENAGTLNHDAGTIGGTLTNTDGTTTVAAGASVTGRAFVSGGALTNSGTIGDGIEVTGGTATVANGGVVNGAASLLDGGALNIDAGGNLNTDLTVNDGAAVNSGTITGAVSVDGGSFSTDGTVNGDVTNNAVTNAEGTINGAVTNNATMTVTGNLGGIGALINNDVLNLNAGTVTTTTSVNNTGVVTALGGAALTATGAFTNAAGGNLNFDIGGGTATVGSTGGVFTNSGTIALVHGAGTGTLTIEANGGLVNTAGSEIGTLTGQAGDVVLVNGNVSGDTQLRLNTDLSVLDAGVSDLFQTTGTMGGTLNVDFTSVGGLALQSNRIVFVQTAGLLPGFDLQSVTGLPGGGLMDVAITQDADSIGMQLLPNTSLGGVAGTLGSVQAVIGSVVNRPSSPFVSRVLFDAVGGCTPGAWARGIMGRATADTTTNFGGTGVTVPSTSRLSYRGIQGGFDVSCIDDGPGGLEYAFGVSLGENTGSTRQNRFAFDPITLQPDLTMPLSPITGSFNQRYAAVYVVAERDNWVGDLQLRHERTSVSFTNLDLGLDNSTIRTRGTTLSGSVTYFHSLENGFTLAPTAGFAITRTGSGTLNFASTDPLDPPGTIAATLTAEPHTSKVGFIGLSLARSHVNEEAQSATTGFVTTTLYNDFARMRRTRFGLAGGGATTDLDTRTLGAYGELSLGMSYVKLFSEGAGPVRQLTATLRGDARFSGRLESYGLTAQVRLNF